ncbi:MAG: hypothetical protein ACQETE_14765 [Bacteroidota bacterium]
MMRIHITYYLGGLFIGVAIWIGIGVQQAQAQTIKEMINERSYYYVSPSFGPQFYMYRRGEEISDAIRSPDSNAPGDPLPGHMLTQWGTEMGIGGDKYRLGLKFSRSNTIDPDGVLGFDVQKETYFGIAYDPFVLDRPILKSSINFQFAVEGEFGYYHLKGKYEDMDEYYAAGNSRDEIPIKSSTHHAVGGSLGISLGLGVNIDRVRLRLGVSPVNAVLTSRTFGYRGYSYFTIAVGE